MDAPATNPDAEPDDDVTVGAEDDRERGTRSSADPRDTWINEQRPPHWD